MQPILPAAIVLSDNFIFRATESLPQAKYRRYIEVLDRMISKITHLIFMTCYAKSRLCLVSLY